MRVFVMFDLPVETAEERHAYAVFRRALIKEGFIMLQESVYCKMLTTPSVENSVRTVISKYKPQKGLVQLLTITEKQFSKMENIVGEYQSEVLDSDKRLVIL